VGGQSREQRRMVGTQSVTCQCVTLLGPTSGYLYDEILLAAMIEARIRPDAADS